LQHRLPPTTSTSTPKPGHATPLTSHFKMAELHGFHVLAAEGVADQLVRRTIVDTPIVRRISDHLPCYAGITPLA
ncbi:hypothetical protein, partial [Streptomyces sp. NPDC048473]|uniref:hypothetical protein n=1 Tax=Streptomyces sp. NPDC048473 TaxID=3365556 RepID=UPI00371C1C92